MSLGLITPVSRLTITLINNYNDSVDKTEGTVNNGQSRETLDKQDSGQRQAKQKTKHREQKQWATPTPPIH